MNFLKNLFLKRIFCFLLIFVMMFTIVNKSTVAYANPVVIGTEIGVKVFATILSSMGILSYAELEHGDVGVLLNDMATYSDNVMGKDFRKMLFDVFMDSLVSKTKMKIDEITDIIKSYFSSLSDDVPDLSVEFTPVAGVVGSGGFSVYNTNYYDFRDNSPFLNYPVSFHSPYYRTLKTVDLNQRYTLYINAYAANSYDSRYVSLIIYDNEESVDLYLPVSSSGALVGVSNDDFDYHVSFSYSNTMANIFVENYNRFTRSYGSVSAVLDYGFLSDFNLDDSKSPTIVSPPRDLSFPYEGSGLDVNNLRGLTKDDLLANLSLLPLSDLLDFLRDKSPSDVSGISNTVISLDKDDVITEVYEPVVDVPKNPTYPFTLKGLIDALLDMLKSLFIPKVGFLDAHVSDMLDKIKNKIGDNVYISLFNQLKGLNGIPIPDQFINGHKVLDAKHINSFADIIKGWQRWFFYIVIALYNLNNLYKLIRNGEMTGLSGGDKK